MTEVVVSDASSGEDRTLTEDEEFEIEEIESEESVSSVILDQRKMEKVLGSKVSEDGEIMFFMKWANMAYCHCTWESQTYLEQMGAYAKGKIRRYLQSSQRNISAARSDEGGEASYFNPEYLQVDRIVSCHPLSNDHSAIESEEQLCVMLKSACSAEIWYFVKWRSLHYDECTWERAADLTDNCTDIMSFWKRQILPRKYKYGQVKPSIADYAKLEKSPVYGGPGAELTLRPYQMEGVNWLLWNWFHKRSCILADEMGLGKTIQTAGFLQLLRDGRAIKIRGPHLIVAPLSLIRQWENELSVWCPDMNCVVLHGNVEARDILIQNEFYFQKPFSSTEDIKDAKKQNAFKFDVLVTTYEVVVRDLAIIKKVPWKVVVFDEGHRLKNPSSRTFERLLEIQRDFCLLLTGTPLQNKTEELWALLHFCNRQKFASVESFSKEFGDLKGSTDVAKLHALLKPFLLRRIKEDVEKSLPPKEETIIEVSLTSIQKKYYRAVFERNAEYLYRGAKPSNGPSLMNIMMELRKCCNHPYLMNGVEERVLEELQRSNPESSDCYSSDSINCAMIESSGKLVLLDKLLPRLQQEGHKVLIFSQMVRALNIIEDFLRYRSYSFERLDGSTRVQDRLTAISRFGKPSLNTFVMLLSTKAGGLGLNLTAADTVIIYDSDWNPQNDLQAQARAHRIGQTKPVVVYRLITRNTYEMQMFHRASLKLGLDRAVLAQARREMMSVGGTEKQLDSTSDALSVAEIDELLKKGAYDVFREDDSDIKEFMAADVDAILARSSTTVQYDGASGTSLSGKLGSFSKASFVSADDSEDVDINDPDFWWKTMRLENKKVNLDSDAALYSEVITGDDGEIRILRTSLRKRKRTEPWNTPLTPIDNLPSTVQSQFYQEEDAVTVVSSEDSVRSDTESSSEDEVFQNKKVRTHKENDKTGVRSKKMNALVATQQLKIPSLEFLSSYCTNVAPSRPRLHEKNVDRKKLYRSKLNHSASESFKWTLEARDRCLDALLRFGFSRWEKISRGMNAGNFDFRSCPISDVELLCRNFVMQCGLSVARKSPFVSLQDSSTHSEFVRNAMQAALHLHGYAATKKQQLDVPSVLLDAEFQEKLNAGKGLKALNRLDFLNRVIDRIYRAVSTVHHKFPGRFASKNGQVDFEEAVNGITPSLLSDNIEINKVKLPWLEDYGWWDHECSIHLILGTFKYGFSAYEEIELDPNLCFRSKMRGNNHHFGSVGEQDTAKTDVSLMRKCSNDDSIRQRDSDCVSIHDENPVEGEIEQKCGFQHLGTAADGVSSATMPSRHLLNQLLTHILSFPDKIGGKTVDTSSRWYDVSRPTKADNVKYESEDQAQVTLQKGMRKRSNNFAGQSGLVFGLSTNHRGKNADSQNSEEQEPENKEALKRMIARGRMGLRRDEIPLLQNISVSDSTFMTLALSEGSLKICEKILKSVTFGPTAKEFTNPMKAVDHPAVRAIVDGDSIQEVDAKVEYRLDRDERERLTSFFVLHGAPALNVEADVSAGSFDNFPGVYTSANILDPNYAPRQCPSIPDMIVRAMLGTSSEHNTNSTGEVLSWTYLKEASGSSMGTAELRWYYEEIWLPFCDTMTRPSSRDMEVYKGTCRLPNPFQQIQMHSPGARGLVELFLLRQRVLYAIRYIIWNKIDTLNAFLCSGCTVGKGDQAFPSWWSPCVHDLGILVGCIKHGYLAISSILLDPLLPFHSNVCRYQTDFPDTKLIEQRMISLLTEVTMKLPKAHVANLSSLFIHGTISQASDDIGRFAILQSSLRPKMYAVPSPNKKVISAEVYNQDSSIPKVPNGLNLPYEVRTQREIFTNQSFRNDVEPNLTPRFGTPTFKDQRAVQPGHTPQQHLLTHQYYASVNPYNDMQRRHNSQYQFHSPNPHFSPAPTQIAGTQALHHQKTDVYQRPGHDINLMARKQQYLPYSAPGNVMNFARGPPSQPIRPAITSGHPKLMLSRVIPQRSYPVQFVSQGGVTCSSAVPVALVNQNAAPLRPKTMSMPSFPPQRAPNTKPQAYLYNNG